MIELEHSGGLLKLWHCGIRRIHGLNTKLYLQNLFGLLCTALLIGSDTAIPPTLLPAFELEGAIGQPK